MRTKIESSVEFFGLRLRIDKYLEQWAKYGANAVETLPFKRDMRGWNTGAWTMQPMKVVHAYTSYSTEKNTVGVFEIWERQDGMGMECYKFDSLEDYNNYNPSNEMPYAIKHEIGLCADYHKGI